MAPPAPRMAIIQNPFAHARATAGGSGGHPAAAARLESQPDAAPHGAVLLPGACTAPLRSTYRVSPSVFGVMTGQLRRSRRSCDRPAEHHGVVLVGEVVAVRDVRADEVTEPAVDDHRLGGVQGDQVLTRDVVRVPRVPTSGDVAAVAHDRAV